MSAAIRSGVYFIAISQGIKSSYDARVRQVLHYPPGAPNPFRLRLQTKGGGGQTLFGASGQMEAEEMNLIWTSPPAAQEDRDYYWRVDPRTNELLEASQATPAAPIGTVVTYDQFLDHYGLERAQPEAVVLTRRGAPVWQNDILARGKDYPLDLVRARVRVNILEQIDDDRRFAIIHTSDDYPAHLRRSRDDVVTEELQALLALWLIASGVPEQIANEFADVQMPADTTREHLGKLLELWLTQ